MAKPSLVIERPEQSWYKVLSRKSVSFKSLNALLELEEHVQADYHRLFQIGVRYLLVKEVTGDEGTQALLQ